MTPADQNGAARLLAETVLRAFLAPCRLKVSGLHHVPREGPLLIACNHVSNWDPPLLNTALASARRPRYLGKKELFDLPLLGRLFRAGGGIPLDRRGDPAAMREALDALSRGGSLAIFPEGTRVKPGSPEQTPKPGVGFLAARTKALVVPARLLGSERMPFARPEVRFGSPLPPPASDDRETSISFAQTVMAAIKAL